MSNRIIDTAAIMDNLGDDLELVIELFKLYLDKYDDYIQGIQSAFDEKSTDLVNRAAHKMKGTLQNLCAIPVVELAYSIEKGALEKGLDFCQEKFVELQELNKQLLAEIQGYVDRNSLD